MFVVGVNVKICDSVTTPLLIIFYSFYLFVNNNLIFFILYPQKMSKNVEFTGFLKIKYGHLQAN